MRMGGSLILVLVACWLVVMHVAAELNEQQPSKYLYLNIKRGFEIESRINETHSLVKFTSPGGPERVVVEDKTFWQGPRTRSGYWYTVSNYTNRRSDGDDLRINIRRLIKHEERLNTTHSKYKYTDTGELVLVSHKDGCSGQFLSPLAHLSL